MIFLWFLLFGCFCVAVEAAQKIDFVDTEFDADSLEKKGLCSKHEELSSCQMQHGTFDLNPFTIVNYQRKILMEYTLKADCTSAVAMFLEQVGFRYGVEYKGWPQFFLEKYYEPHCGRPTVCTYYYDDWYRFKVTRNPYDRAVSSYLYIMKNPPLSEKAIPEDKRENMTFEQFIDHMLTLSEEEMQYYGEGHGGYQSQVYERALFQKYQHRKSFFHHIVHIEDPKALDPIRERFNFTSHLNYMPPHHAVRTNKEQGFVGNVPYDQLKEHVPTDYGLFYDLALKEKVSRRFHWDLAIYNYTFPFHIQIKRKTRRGIK